METVGVTAGQPVPDPEKHQGTHQAHGLATPEGTPAPDDARTDADIARRQAESQSANAQQDPPKPSEESRTGPEGRSEHGNGENKEDEESEEEEEKPATKEQIEAVGRVMKCGKKAYREILGVKDTYANENEGRQEVLDAFRELGCLVHSNYNDDKQAKKAFGRK